MKRLILSLFLIFIFSVAAIAQARNQQPSGAPRSGALKLTGTATNGTTNKPAAGDSVVLLKPGQSMEEVSRSKVDSSGKFTIMVPEDGMPVHAIRVNHQGVDFVKPVRAGETSVQITVYDAEPILDGIKVTNQSEIYTAADSSSLSGVEFFVINNTSTPPKAQPAFQFYLPDGAKLVDGQAISGELMPVRRTPVPLDEKNKYEFRYPLRPGVTQFEVRFTIPYGGTINLNSKVASNVEKFYVVTPKTIKFNGGGSGFHAEEWPVEPGLAVDSNVIDQPAAGKQVAYELSGTGNFPDAPAQTASNNGRGGGGAQENNRPGGGMGIPNASPIPLDSSKLGFLGALVGFLAVGGAIVFFMNRQPVAVPAGAAMAMGRAQQQNHSAALLDALKEEMFQLESERVKNKISQQDYEKAKAALDNTLQRAMKRHP